MTDRMRDQQVTNPFFSGITPKGEEILVTADTARPGGKGVLSGAENLQAILKMTDGRKITLNSDTGTVDPVTDIARFDGNVRITTSTGFLLLTDTLNAALSGIEADTPGEVRGTSPIGDIIAGRMQITAKNGKDDVHVLFKNGVNLIYQPKPMER